MLKSILMGVLAVALVSWAMGAYNRLVRLRAAMGQAFTVWQQALQGEPKLAEHQTPEEKSAQWQKIEAERLLCKEAYETAVTKYNLAIAQIPTAWLAMLFGFKSERCKAAHSDEGRH
ncbi:MAG: LemA family protein [Burkholderiaceae bacterium]|nr:LemA family protein [Burkholderiaceae bacterium]